MFNRYRNMRELEHFMRYNTADVPGAYKWRVLFLAIGALLALTIHVFAIIDCCEYKYKCENYQEVTLIFKGGYEQKIYRHRGLDDVYYKVYFEGEEKSYIIDVIATYRVDEVALDNTRSGDEVVCFVVKSDDDKYSDEIISMTSEGRNILTLEDYKSAYTLHYVLWIAGSGLVFLFFAISAVSTAVRKGAGEPEFRVRRR